MTPDLLEMNHRAVQTCMSDLWTQVTGKTTGGLLPRWTAWHHLNP